MKKYRQLTLTIALLCAGLVPVAANSASEVTAGTNTPPVSGIVKKVNPDQGKVTIKHGPIQNLDMPPMTMVFRVQEKAMLANLKPGDKIQLAVEDQGGKMVVTNIQVAP